MTRQLPSASVADRCIRWLNTAVEPGTWILVWCDGREHALDLTRRVSRAFHGEHSATTIAYDNPPTAIENVRSGLRVYFVTQPDHLQTIVSNLQGKPMAQWRERIGPVGQRMAGMLGWDHVDRTDLIAAAPDSAKIAAAAQRGGLDPDQLTYVRKPTEIIADAERPVWTALRQMCGKNTRVLDTDRVHPHFTAAAEAARVKGLTTSILTA